MRTIIKICSFFVWIFKGEKARQKFLFKFNSRFDAKRLQNFWRSSGGLMLDDIEMRTYHPI